MSQSLRILLIADDPEVIQRIGQGLQRQDSGLILIEGAESLATARRRLNAGAYDLALVDLALGQGDGLHLLSDLRDVAPELPIVALASDHSAPDAAACMALGAQDRLGPQAMDSAGLVDRLQAATARARSGENARRRSKRIAASLDATGDLAWHYEAGADDVWLAAADPDSWQLPGPECRESLDALRARIHPDDRELAVRRIGELVLTDATWQTEARVKVGGGAYRWCALRGRSQFDPKGQLQRVSGVVSDAQRQQKRVREREQGRRFLRAIFDSQQMPQAVIDSSAVITDCNQAWLELDEPACHAGRGFGPGSKFTSPPEDPARFGDLDAALLSRGVKQVLGGVVEHYECEYGDGKRRWRVHVSPLLNPGIAGAVISHEEITAARRADLAARKRLAALEADFRAVEVPFFRVGPDFEVKAANEAAKAVGRAPVTGRDVLQVLPRADADAVSDGLVALSSGARTATRDSKPKDGRVTRWLLSVRDDEDGNDDGFLLLGVGVADLVSEEETVPDAVHQRELGELRKLLGQTESERGRLGKLLGELEGRAGELRANLERALLEAESARRDADAAKRDAETARREVDTARRDVEQAHGNAVEAKQALLGKERALEAAQRRQAELEQESRKLAEALEAERASHGEALAALSAAGQVPLKMRSELDRARHALQRDLDELLERVFQPLLADPAAAGPEEDADGSH